MSAEFSKAAALSVLALLAWAQRLDLRSWKNCSIFQTFGRDHLFSLAVVRMNLWL